jgi:predicted porin
LRQLARSFVISTTAESSMNKKLVTLAVAAAIAAPTAVMAEAVLYGKLHVSIDYQDVKNAIPASGAETINFGDLTVDADSPMDAGGGNQTFTGTYVDPVSEETKNFTLTTTQDVLEGADLSELDQIRLQQNGIVVLDSAGKAQFQNKGQDFKGWGINGRSSGTGSSPDGYLRGAPRSNRVGVKGSEDLGSGLKAIYQVEFGVQLADTNANIASGGDNVTMRNSFVGLAGDWGTFLVGRHDTPLKISTGKLDLFSDTMADYNGTVGFQDIRADNVVAYISPSFSGLSFAGAVVAPGGTELGGSNINADSLAEAYSLALIYKNGPWYASAAYESISNEMYMGDGTSLAGSSGCLLSDGTPTLTCSYLKNDFTKWRLGLGILDWNGFTLAAVYEQQDDLPAGQTRESVAFVNQDGELAIGTANESKNQTLYQISAGYTFGNNMIKAMWGSVDRDNTKLFAATRETTSLRNIRTDLSGDRSTWAVGFDHNFSKRTKAYVLYTAVDDDQGKVPDFGGEQWSGFSLGMVHKF